MKSLSTQLSLDHQFFDKRFESPLPQQYERTERTAHSQAPLFIYASVFHSSHLNETIPLPHVLEALRTFLLPDNFGAWFRNVSIILYNGSYSFNVVSDGVAWS